MTKKQELKKEIEKCEECCYVRDMTDIKPQRCEYHNGLIKGRAEMLKEIEDVLEGDWIAERIETEFKKHYLHGLRFEKIAQGKIRSQIIENLKEKTQE